MEELVAWIGYFVTSIGLLGLVLVVIRLLLFISTVSITLVLLQYVLPNMALFGSEGPRNEFVFLVMFIAILLGAALDLCSIPKRASHFWDIAHKPWTKD